MPEPSRLPVVAIAVMAMEHVAPLLIALVPLLGASWQGRVLAIVPFTIALISAGLRFLRFRYTIAGDLLTIEGGLLFRWRREIPFARVQSVDVVQKLRHQIFGVVELRIEVIGGRATEASFPALMPDEAERIRSTVLAGEPRAPRPEISPELARMRTGDLLLAGMTGGRVAVVALLIGYLQEVVPEDIAAGLVERIATSGVAAVLVVVSLFLAVSIVISIVGTVLVYWDFTLRRDGTRIVITRGLLERRRAAIPLARLQALRVHANPVRRLLGLASVSAVVAGYTQQRDEQRQMNMVLPIARREAAFRIAGELLDASPGLEGLARERLPVRALAQRLTYALVVGLGLGAAGLIAFGAPGAAAIGAVPLLGAWAWGAWRAAGYGVSSAHVVVRGGALFRRHFIVPIANVQHVELRASPLQNAFGVATLRLRIPKAAPAVPGLLRGRAEESFGALSSKLPA